MKKLITLIVIISNLYGWEINTHRAIDRVAIKKSESLKSFLVKIGKDLNSTYEKNSIEYENYFTSYISYILNGEPDGISQWNQTFNYNVIDDKANIQDLIEAGTILEDAQWADAWVSWNGRFNNHFYDPQNGGKGLTIGYGRDRVDALSWAWNGSKNDYSYLDVVDYFGQSFTSSSFSVRKSFQAKMFVALGHIMHMMNDMNVPAHTRDDAHPRGDALEWWARGGEQGNEPIGFYIRNLEYAGSSFEMKKVNIYKYGDYKSTYFGELYGYMKKEAKFTGTHFFSGYARTTTIDKIDTIEKKEYPAKYHEGECKSTGQPNVEQCYIISDELSTHKRLAIKINSYFYNALGETRIDLQMHGGNMRAFQGDMKVLEDNAYHLIPRAIANATGFLNYFFRGSMKVNSADSVVSIINDSDENLVASPSVVTFKDGKLKFYCDDKNYNRSKFHSEDITETASGDELVSVAKDTLYSDFQNKSCEKENNVTILYDGTIGNEKGLSVVVIPASDIIPQDGRGDDSNEDNTDDNNTGGDSDNGTGADNGDGSNNGDNNATDPTKDPNKVCVSNFFDYGNGQIIEDLKKGDKDAELYSDGTKHQVKELQEFLEAFGYDVGSSGADGWFGSDTKTALINFQDANGLDADGIVGPNTRDAMNSQNCYDK